MLEITPGMPAELLIMPGELALLQYLVNRYSTLRGGPYKES